MADDFQRLWKASRRMKRAECQTALAFYNYKRNRYANVLPYDDTRVKLLGRRSGDRLDSADYINASHVGPYIATQAPLEHTIGDFWRMVLQQDRSVIVMLCPLETGQCAVYFPQNVGDTIGCDDGTEITCLSVTSLIPGALQKRLLRVGDCHIVEHFHYLTWPDHGNPSDTVAIRTLLDTVAGRASDMVVHCSAGVGRTGVFIALHRIVNVPASTVAPSLFATVLRMREARTGMIQTLAQYRFCLRYLDQVK